MPSAARYATARVRASLQRCTRRSAEMVICSVDSESGLTAAAGVVSRSAVDASCAPIAASAAIGVAAGSCGCDADAAPALIPWRTGSLMRRNSSWRHRVRPRLGEGVAALVEERAQLERIACLRPDLEAQSPSAGHLVLHDVLIEDRRRLLAVQHRHDAAQDLARRDLLELTAGEVDHETVDVLHPPVIAPGRDDLARRRPLRSVAVPPHRIVEREALAGLGRRFRHPIRLGVVVDVRRRRDLDELYGAVAEAAPRRDPHARTQIGAGFEVLVVAEVAVTLDQAEPLWVQRLERVHAERLRVVERPPQPLALEVDLQAVGVVDLGPEVGKRPDRVLAEVEHAGERRDPELLHGFAQEQPALDRDDRLLAGRDDEAIRARDARAVEEREDFEALRTRRGGDEPELAEVRELLAARQRGIDGEPARREPVLLVRADGTEVARAEKDDHLVEAIRDFDRVVDAEPGVAEVLRHFAREVVLPVIELA